MFPKILIGIVFFSLYAIAWAKDNITNLEEGAYIYRNFCILCHGLSGMGNGAMPAVIPGYPPTNLLKKDSNLKRDGIINIIAKGGRAFQNGVYMPPWESTLNKKEIGQVADFVIHLRENTNDALRILQEKSQNFPPTKRHGNLLYRTYCQKCHGVTGKGDGRLATYMQNPPPFNLTLSRADDGYLFKIISNGGAGVGRSPTMPPWGSEVGEGNILSLIMFIKSLRTDYPNNMK